MPRAKEGEFRRKYELYTEKLAKYELAARKLELVLSKDAAGLRALKHSYDPERYGGGQLNQETQLLAQ